MVNPCEPNPCQHDGTCHNNGDGTYRCDCVEGFDGIHCEHGEYGDQNIGQCGSLGGHVRDKWELHGFIAWEWGTVRVNERNEMMVF